MIRKSISGFHLELFNIKLNKNTLDDFKISINYNVFLLKENVILFYRKFMNQIISDFCLFINNK